MNKVYRSALSLVISLALAGAAWANDAAGTIKSSKGQVNIERAGEKVSAAVGSPVFVSEQLIRSVLELAGEMPPLS